MGYLKNKYTEEYFTGHDRKGKKLKYGVEGYDSYLNGHIRDIDLSILDQINFKNNKVLEFGFGRGEAIKYSMEHGAISYVGVDFAKPAMDLAKKFIKLHKIKNTTIYQDDALDFIKNFSKNIKNIKNIDIILMFDFIEHVPRSELKEIFTFLKKVISNKAIIAINTPNFKFDNDVIKNGLDNRNNLNTYDTSDLINETKGMHCNKYTTISLQKFMKDNNFLNITEHHFYVQNIKNNSSIYMSYRDSWIKHYQNKFPLNKNYVDDKIETPNKENPLLKLIKFTNGHLKKINLLLTEEYYKTILSLGEYDKELFNDFEKNTNHNETIFDVGSCMGINSLIFSKIVGKKGKIIAFEPNPYNLNRILINISKNENLSKNISIVNIAISNKTGSTELLLSSNIDDGYSSTSRLLNTHVEHSHQYLKKLGFFKQRIQQDTLDNFVKNSKFIPNIIKVDIEGAEHLLLLGAKETLKKYEPVLYVELHSQYCALKCTELMCSLGYENSILFEEQDNRILVKYYKDKIKKKKNNAKFKKIEKKIIDEEIFMLKNKINKIHNQNSELASKNENLKNKIIFIENENNKLDNKLTKLEKYLIKLINNPIIKTEIKIFRLFKKVFN